MLNSAHQSNVVVQLIDEVLRLHGRLRSVFSGVAAETGLTPMESTVLSAVVEAHVPPTVPQIGRSLGHPRQVIQRGANALIEAGLIRTEPNPHHKRAPLLLPTDRGNALKDKESERALKAAEALLRAVDARKCKRLTEELHSLRGEIESYLRAKDASHDQQKQRRGTYRRAQANGVARR